MSQHPSAQPPPSNPDPAAAPVLEPGFEVMLHSAWEKYHKSVQLACVVVLLGIVVWKGKDYVMDQRERALQGEFAQVANDPVKLAAFATAHQGHVLAGVARLMMADEKFSAGDFTAATAEYQKAAGDLKNEALLGRAKLGAAISQVRGDNKTGGEADLKTLMADATQNKVIRSEAAFHLATMAAAAGQADEARKLIEQVSQIDASGPWAQRAVALLANLPPAVALAAPATPGLNLQPAK